MATNAVARAVQDPQTNRALLDAEMFELSRTFDEWREGQDLTLTEAALRVQRYTYPEQRLKISHATLSRWKDPRTIATTKFVSIRAAALAFGKTMTDVAERLEFAQIRLLAGRSGQSDEVTRQYIARKERQVRMMEAFNALPDGLQMLALNTVQGMAHANEITPVDDRLDLVPGLEASYQLSTAGERAGQPSPDARADAMMQRVRSSMNIEDPQAPSGPRATEQRDREA